MTCRAGKTMADPSQNTPPSLLFPASDSLALDAFRPVPATALLFPAEDGEADSFLGQTAEPSVDQTTQPQVPFFTTTSSSSAFDPFANISQPAFLPSQAQQSTALPTNPTQPPLFPPSSSSHQPVSFSSPAPSQPSQLFSSGPPIGTPSTQQGPSLPVRHDPNAPPPTCPPQGRSGGFGGVKLGQGYKPVLYPMGGVRSTPPTSAPPMGTLPIGGSPMETPPTGPPSHPMFDSSRPPPTSADLYQVQSTGPQSGASPAPGGTQYHPVQPHWFYCKEFEKGQVWNPFSILDSIRLDEALHASYSNSNEDTIISTDGGRYDVNIQQRQRHAIYWDEKPSSVRRCTWFYKSDGENRFLPYKEALADKLEQEYKLAVLNNVWHKRLEFADGETIVMHNPNVIVHFRPPSRPDDFGTSPDGQMRPRVVKRGVDDAENIHQGEPNQIDHLVFIVHGIGPVCDLRFRGIVECVDDFRSVSLGLMNSHFKHSQEDGRTGRSEFLPVYWYDALHGDATGVDRHLRRITLPSISRLRRFTNDTLLDILFYSSPSYSQKIAEHVCSEINRLYQLFQERNPEFQGQVSLVGHSLGSLIVFDLLSHQRDGQLILKTTDSHADTPDHSIALPGDELTENLANEEAEEEVMTLNSTLAQLGLTDFLPKFEEERIDMESLLMCSDSDLKEMGLPLGPRKKFGGFLKEQATKEERNRKAREARMRAEAERQAMEVLERERQEASSASQLNDVSTHSVHVDFEPGLGGVGQPFVQYSQLDFKPQSFYAIGSPIGMFLTVRGVSRVGEEYKLPTCEGFFNIFHPFDPVAYRMEPLVHSDMADAKPFLIPHHKGRKRFHLELRESLSAFGSDLKRNLIDSMKKTWNSIHEFARAHRGGAEVAVPAVSSEEMEAVAEKLSMEEMTRQEQEREGLSSREPGPSTECELRLGLLNNGRRVDYVLQEAPLESFNEYLFALGSHTCYWDSEDTVLLILKEVYASLGVFPLVHGPKQDSAPATPLHQ